MAERVRTFKKAYHLAKKALKDADRDPISKMDFERYKHLAQCWAQTPSERVKISLLVLTSETPKA
jgi:tRNA(Leu) C34 or U34 (ribose-2'-O)-methylase TrmL